MIATDNLDYSNDQTLAKLYSNTPAENAGQLMAYPQDIINDDTPGHFIMFQSNSVQGIVLEKFKRIVSAATKEYNSIISIAESLNYLKEKFENNSLIQNAITIAQTEYNKSLEQTNQNNIVFNKRGTKPDEKYIFGDKSLDTKFNVSETMDYLGRKRTLKDTIILYMPESVQTAYSSEYSMDNNSIGVGVRAALDAFSNAASIGKVGIDILKVLRDVAIANPEASAGLAAAGAAKALNAVGASNVGTMAGGFVGAVGTNIVKGPLSSLTRKVINPYMEFLFKSVNQRTFQYTFNFFPQSKQEAEMIHRIIKAFKLASHPKSDSIHAFLTMPYEFDITFYSNLRENKYINRVLPSALTNMEVIYTPDGMPSFFKDDGDSNGVPPTRITINLTFQEIGLLDKEHIEAGY